MATLRDLMTETEKLKLKLFQERMLSAPSYPSAYYFKLRADFVLYRAERRIKKTYHTSA